MTLFLVGLLSLLAQVVLLRELNVAFFGVELVYVVALAAWLAGTAAGSALVPGSRHAAAWPLAAAAVLLVLDVALVRGSRRLFDAVPGAYLSLGQQLTILVLAVGPIACLFGMAFRWAAAYRVAAGGTLARAYALESLGAAAGGLATTIAFQAGASTFSVAAAACLLLLALLGTRLVAGSSRRAVTAVLLLAAAALAARPARDLDFRMTRWNHPALAETRDTPYARVTVSRAGGQVSVFENDVLTHESESAENEELAHLAALQHPAPERMLLLGGVAEQIEGQLRRHHPVAVDHVEMDAALVAMVQRNLPPATAADRDRPIIDDPRAYLAIRERSSGDGDAPSAGAAARRSASYDLIVVALAEPVSGQANRFYTQEFFERCAARLAPSGVLAFRLRLPENYLAAPAVMRAASIASALVRVFPFVDYLPGTTTVVVASRAPLPAAEDVARRLVERQLGTRLVTARYVHYLYGGDRRAELRRVLAGSTVPANRDARPICYFFASVTWLSKFVPALVASNDSLASAGEVPRGWRWAALGLLAVLTAACRLRPGTRRAALALASGLGGMALETVVLLDYQAKNGALFQDLGVLVMAFMLGSAAGSWLVDRSTRPGRVEQAPRESPRLLSASLVGGLVVCSLVTASLAASTLNVGLTGAAALLAALGALVAAVFSAASRIGTAGDERAIGRLYAADLAGGCLGGLAASLVFVPLGGLDVTARLVAVFSAVMLLLA